MATDIKQGSQQTPAPSYSTPHGIFPGKPQIAYPETPGFAPVAPFPVVGVILSSGAIDYNTDRRTVTLKVRNTGDRPVQVGSHFHFFEVNRYLEFDRKAAFGCHLNIPATTAVRFEPGDEKKVEFVTFAGKQRIIGFNGLVDGYAGLEDEDSYYTVEMRAFRRMQKYGFKNISEEDADSEYTSRS